MLEVCGVCSTHRIRRGGQRLVGCFYSWRIRKLHLRAGERFGETILVERFQQVVERGGVEGAHGVLVIRGEEDDDRGFFGGDVGQHAEAVFARHLHVEEEQVGALFFDGGDRFKAVITLASDRISSLRASVARACGRSVVVD